MTPSRIVVETLQSRSLQGNPLGDPATRPLWIYLPPDYDEGTGRYPCVYLLASYSATGRSFMNHRPWEEDIQQRMDRLIEAGSCRPMILVLPDAFTRYGGSQYINSSATGRYQDYLLEIVEFLDARYRTRPRRDFRAVAGNSSGGFGALTAVMDHPSVFGLVADHSGDKGFDRCYARSLAALPDTLARVDASAILADPYSVQPKDETFFNLMDAAAMAAAYSPSRAAPLGFDWPVDTFTGELIPRVWRRWQAHDPLERAPSSADSLRRLRLLYFDCGNHDEYRIHLGCRSLSRQLTRLEVPHTYEEYEGGHSGTRHRLDVSLAALSAAMPS